MGQNAENSASRNDLAEDRTILANERTFAGWMRTAFGAIALGIGFNALFGEWQPSWLPRAVATGFLVLAMVVIVLAERRSAAVLERLTPHIVESSRPINLKLYVALTVAGSAMLIAAIWLSR